MLKALLTGLFGLGMLLSLVPTAQAKHHIDKEQYDKVIEAIEDNDYDEFKDELDDLVEEVDEDDFDKIRDYYYQKKYGGSNQGYKEQKYEHKHHR